MFFHSANLHFCVVTIDHMTSIMHDDAPGGGGIPIPPGGGGGKHLGSHMTPHSMSMVCLDNLCPDIASQVGRNQVMSRELAETTGQPVSAASTQRS